MISRSERERSGIFIGKRRVRTGTSPMPRWMNARCGTGAPLIIQLKISGSASQKSFSGGSTGSWWTTCPTTFLREQGDVARAPETWGPQSLCKHIFAEARQAALWRSAGYPYGDRGSRHRTSHVVASVLRAHAVFRRTLLRRHSNLPIYLLLGGRYTDERLRAGQMGGSASRQLLGRA